MSHVICDLKYHIWPQNFTHSSLSLMHIWLVCDTPCYLYERVSTHCPIQCNHAQSLVELCPVGLILELSRHKQKGHVDRRTEIPMHRCTQQQMEKLRPHYVRDAKITLHKRVCTAPELNWNNLNRNMHAPQQEVVKFQDKVFSKFQDNFRTF